MFVDLVYRFDAADNAAGFRKATKELLTTPPEHYEMANLVFNHPDNPCPLCWYSKRFDIPMWLCSSIIKADFCNRVLGFNIQLPEGGRRGEGSQDIQSLQQCRREEAKKRLTQMKKEMPRVHAQLRKLKETGYLNKNDPRTMKQIDSYCALLKSDRARTGAVSDVGESINQQTVESLEERSSQRRSENYRLDKHKSGKDRSQTDKEALEKTIAELMSGSKNQNPSVRQIKLDKLPPGFSLQRYRQSGKSGGETQAQMPKGNRKPTQTTKVQASAQNDRSRKQQRKWLNQIQVPEQQKRRSQKIQERRARKCQPRPHPQSRSTKKTMTIQIQTLEFSEHD